ncbi:hypothetical protein [Microbacterium sp. 179-I 3D3 NHS]|uniref:hypothetical protein n=1 Tax=Microbacterium sp. 179-I 3D3 NHS TaxID=3142382 RepID=UPI0039A0EA3A
MILLIALSALIVWAVVATVIELRRDGYRRTPTDWSRLAGRAGSAEAESRHLFR